MKKYWPVAPALMALAALMLCSQNAAEGARRGLAVCAGSLAPSLLPFFTLSNILSSLGLAELLAGTAGGVMRRLLHVSGAGAQAFFLGVTGGYPLGASVTARLRRDGAITREEAERLLAFCNNSGPGFILGAAGGAFGSAAAGLLLYAAHVLAAVCVGLLMRGKGGPPPEAVTPETAPVSFAAAFPDAVSRAAASTLSVCAYVTLFSALLGMLTALSALPPLLRALCTGFFELGGGIASLAGMEPTPLSLAAAALMLGWGGLSVHCQTLGAVAGTDIKCARHLAGRALCGSLAAIFTYALALIFF